MISTETMKILISNDDGIFAEGLRCLAETLAEEHDIYLCVPDRERSATGHSMSLNKPLMLDPLKEQHLINNIKAGFLTSGTPADCVKVALGALWKDIDFDLMISGINHGPNLGVDVLYSGTVSAAMEAMILGLRSIAVSLNSYSSKDFRAAAKWVRDFIQAQMPLLDNLGPKTFLNINIPEGSDYQGLEFTRLGNRYYEENYEERMDPRGRRYFWLAGRALEDREVAGTDGWALLQQRVSVSPVIFNMTDFTKLQELQQ